MRLKEIDVPTEDIEWQFWNLVGTPDRPLEVLYGSDLDTLVYGSGFPKPPPKPVSMAAAAAAAAAGEGAVGVVPEAGGGVHEGVVGSGAPPPSKGSSKASAKAKAKEAASAKAKAARDAAEASKQLEVPLAKRYAAAAWNLGNLCRLERCVLAHCNDDVSGMVVPWLYVGMLFASFCWHVEDHYAHSINYMHWGAPKTWYGVPGDEADAFEAVMREAVPDLVETESGLLYKMVTMVPPGEAAQKGVNVCHLVQQPGSFVITWPRAYHAGFSHGVNCAESSNFATPDWLPWGRASVHAFRTTPGARRPCFTHELLLTTLARKASTLSAHISSWVDAELRTLIKDEMSYVAALRDAGVAEIEEIQDDNVVSGGGGVGAAAAESDPPVPDAPTASTSGDASGGELPDAWAGGPCPDCAACQYECFLSAVVCTAADGTVTTLCPMHALGGEALDSLQPEASAIAAAALPPSSKRLRIYRSTSWLHSLLSGVSARSEAATKWAAHAKRILEPTGGDAPAAPDAPVPMDVDSSVGDGAHHHHPATPAVPVRRATLSEAQSALHAGAQLQMDDEHMLKLTTICTAGKSIGAKGAALHQVLSGRSRGANPTLGECVACLSEADTLPIIFESVEAIRPMVIEASGWEVRANALLDAAQRDTAAGDERRRAGAVRDKLASIDALLAAATAFPIELAAKATLTAAAAAARFEVAAAELLTAEDGAAAAAAAVATKGPMAAGDACDTGSEVAGDAAGGVAGDASSFAAEGAAAATTTMGATSASPPPPPSMATLAALLHSGEAAGTYLSSAGRADLAALSARHGAGVEWIERTSSALRTKGCPIALLHALVNDAGDVGAGVALPAASVASLRERVRAAEEWLTRATELMSTPVSTAAIATMRTHVASTRGALGKVAEVSAAALRLTARVDACDEWLGRCARAFVKPGCDRPLLSLLCNTNIDTYWPPTDEENLLCCPCCTPEHTGIPETVSWLGCDACDAWYHSVCVRVPDELAESLETFDCPRCALANGTPYAFAPPNGLVPAILRTMRPRTDTVEALVAAAHEASLSALPEVAAAQALLDETNQWKARLRADVARAEEGASAIIAAAAAAAAAAAYAPGAPEPPPAPPVGIHALGDEVLVELLRAASALEVAPTNETNQLRLLASRRQVSL